MLSSMTSRSKFGMARQRETGGKMEAFSFDGQLTFTLESVALEDFQERNAHSRLGHQVRTVGATVLDHLNLSGQTESTVMSNPKAVGAALLWPPLGRIATSFEIKWHREEAQGPALTGAYYALNPQDIDKLLNRSGALLERNALLG